MKTLVDYLPPEARLMLESELRSWARRAPERIKDEASLRYIFMSILERCGLPCPHPWRDTHTPYAFTCRMCRATMVETPPKRHGNVYTDGCYCQGYHCSGDCDPEGYYG